MSDIPFVNELGDRLESAIGRQRPHPRRGLVAAVAAFVATVVVVGGTFSWVATGRGAFPSPNQAVQEASVANPGSITASELALALPIPDGMTTIGGIDADALTNTVSRKFRMDGDNPSSAMSISIRYGNDATTVPLTHFNGSSLGHHDTGTVTRSNGMTVLEWEPISGVIIQLVARSESSDSQVDAYARQIDEALGALGNGVR
ncbi:MAG: hypothetical protein DWP92_08840 [Armatimonadetes bacterium]|nr:MAG: hypothetical protein DWP92_08840 [Armatimonadota bacterium]